MSKLMLNSELYIEKNIAVAIRDYSMLCDAHLYKQNEYYIVDFKNCCYDEEKTKKEFENYVIDLTAVKS